MGAWEYVKAIIVICIIIYAAYYVTKITAKASGGKFRKSSNIKLSGSLPLAKDKSVTIVQIGDFAYILGVGGQRVEMLDKIPISELNLKEEDVPPSDITGFLKKRTDDLGLAAILTGLSGFWQRFIREFGTRLKTLLNRGKMSVNTPKNEGNYKTVIPQENHSEFAEILKKESGKEKNDD